MSNSPSSTAPPPAGAELAERARTLLARHLARRPQRNPVAAFRTRIADQAKAVSERAPCFFHLYAFNTLRQLGANFELLGSHLAWLRRRGRRDDCGGRGLGPAFGRRQMPRQFQLARACNRKRFADLESQLDPLVAAYDAAIDGLARLYRA